MAAKAVEVAGLRQFRAELRKLDSDAPWGRELGKVNRELAQQAAGWARSGAQAMGHEQAHFATAIKGYGSAAGARIGIASANKGQRNYGAHGAFWGAKAYPQFNEHVGTTWDVAVRGEGPYAINDVLAARLPQIEDAYRQGVDRLVTPAFPD